MFIRVEHEKSLVTLGPGDFLQSKSVVMYSQSIQQNPTVSDFLVIE